MNPSNLEGAWFAYGAIGLGLYTVVISVAGLRGVQRLNKDMLRLFSCSALLDFVVHMGAFFVYNTDRYFYTTHVVDVPLLVLREAPIQTEDSVGM